MQESMKHGSEKRGKIRNKQIVKQANQPSANMWMFVQTHKHTNNCLNICNFVSVFMISRYMYENVCILLYWNEKYNNKKETLSKLQQINDRKKIREAPTYLVLLF